MLYPVRGRAQEYIGDEAVAMRGHRDEIDIFFAREFDDLVRRFPQRQDGIAGKTLRGQFAAAFFQVKPVLFHFFALCELELIEIARHPAIGHMNEEQFRASHSCKRPDVRKNGLIGETVFEGDEDVFIHERNDEALMSNDEGMTKHE